MCRAVTCRRCDRPTWKGCGMHVEQVLGHVPADQRCNCAEEARAGARDGSLLQRLLGR